jgi:esterase/lipase
MYPCFFCCVRSDVYEKSGLNINDLEVSKLVAADPKNRDKSLFIMAGASDSMIPPEHTQKIYDAFPGKKQMMIF